MSVITKDLGIATAYGYAKSKGYTGTEEEFAELMASYADVAQQAEAAAQDAEDAKDAAVSAKNDAVTAKTAAQAAQSAAETASGTASAKASEAAQSAQSAAGSASAAQTSATAASGSASTAQTAAQTATNKASEASSSASAASTAKTGAETARTGAQTAQANAEAAASSVSASAAQIEQNTEDIAGLKNDLNQFEDVVIDEKYVDITADIVWSVNGYYNSGYTEGELQETSRAKTAFMDVSEGETYRISGRSYYLQKLLCLYKAGESTATTKYSPTNTEVFYENEVVVIPPDIVRIGISYLDPVGINALKLEKLTMTRKTVSAEDTDFFETNAPTNFYNYETAVDGGYIGYSNGAITSNSGMCYAYVPVEAGEYIATVAYNYFGSTASRIPYFDANKTYLGYYQGTYKNQSPSSNLEPCTFTVASNAKYIGISVRTAYKNRAVVEKGSTLSDDFPVYFEKYIALSDGEKVNAENVKGASANPLFRKTVAFDGDSICHGISANDNKSGWAGRIGTANEMNWKNYAVSGGTITNNHSHCIMAYLDTIHTYMPSVDYYIFDGGTNDADRLATSGLGTVTENDFSGVYDTATFSGAFETLLFNALTYYPTTKIGYIVAPKMGKVENANYENRKAYFDRAMQICTKWGVPYIDLWNGSMLNPNLISMYDSSLDATGNIEAGKLYTDGQHLTPTGYEVITPIIEAWMKTL